jgi:hypothetical protein
MAEEIVSPIPDLSSAELADLERDAGRPLTQGQAQRYRLRKLKERLIDNMLNQAARTAGAK